MITTSLLGSVTLFDITNMVMKITETQYQHIEHCMPRQRGDVSHCNLPILNAI